MALFQSQTGVKVLSPNHFMKITSYAFIIHLAISQDGGDFLYGPHYDEHLWTRKLLNFRSTWLDDLSKTILCFDLFIEHFSSFHWNTLPHSNPHCPTQSVVDSSSNKIFDPVPGFDWFLCWRYCSAASCCLFDRNRKWKLAYSTLWVFLTSPSVDFLSQQLLQLAWTGFSCCYWDWDTDTK